MQLVEGIGRLEPAFEPVSRGAIERIADHLSIIVAEPDQEITTAPGNATRGAALDRAGGRDIWHRDKAEAKD
ncbi:hypothetical protein GCM10008966_32390 [Rhodovulum strictum]